MSTTETDVIPAYRSSAAPSSPTETIPTVLARRSILSAAQSPAAPFADWRGQARTEELPAVSSDPGRPATRQVRPSRARRHLRAALAGILIAAALLISMQLFAAAGISSARQAALAARTPQATEQAAAQPSQPAPNEQAEQADAPTAQWAVEGTTTAAPSPLDLPRCTTSPDTPLPCLATISPSQDRAVVLEEDASLTALVRR